jgi:hypothetical protein
MYLDDGPRWKAPLQALLGQRIGIRWRAPITNPDLPVWMFPVRILETWERHSRRPWGNETDCVRCGELVAEQLAVQGYERHVGC